MAFYDNRHWLISHIRNSFISSDDTGICEAVIIDDIPKDSTMFGEHDKYPNMEYSTEEDENYDNSLDIHTESDFGAHRLRANTAQRLAKIEQEMKIQRNIRHVKWQPSQNPMTSEEKEQMFKRKDPVKLEKPVKSMLALQLEKCPTLPRNPFVEYAKFGGNAHVGIPTRTYKVFLTMLSLPDRNYPITVCVLRSAKVSDLIGYVCWKYTTENTDPTFKFKENITNYGLYIAEDDGEVDWDFSSLDRKETVGKFGLAYLALVELPEKDISGSSKPEEPDIGNERPDKLNLHPSQQTDDWKEMKGDLCAIEALLYQSFPVQLVSKMRTRSDVVLGINGDKLEVDPLVTTAKVGGKMWRHKSASYDMEDIVFCDLVESRTSGRAVFRIVRRATAIEESSLYPHAASVSPRSTSTFKHNDFEAEQKVAEEIVKKINLILHLKCSIHRREYLTLRDKKLGRRRSFSLWPR